MKAVKKSGFLYEKLCKVTEPLGICGRPSSAIVHEVARSFGVAGRDRVFIRRVDNERVADPYSIMSVMMLGARKDVELAVCTNDLKLKDKVDALAEFIDRLTIDTHVDFNLDKLYSSTKE